MSTTARGFESFEQVKDQHDTHLTILFEEARKLRGADNIRGSIRAQLLQARDAGKLRLTDVLRESEPYRTFALECLTWIQDGEPMPGDNEFKDLRFRFKCTAKDTRQYKTAVRRVSTVHTSDGGGGIQKSSYHLLEPVFRKIPGGTEVELDVVAAIRLLQMYGEELTALWAPNNAKHRGLRPWVEMGATAEGFDAPMPPTAAAKSQPQASR